MVQVYVITHVVQSIQCIYVQYVTLFHSINVLGSTMAVHIMDHVLMFVVTLF